MKFLVKLLSLFSIHSYSTGINEIVLVCIDEEKYINKDIKKSDYIFGYIFNNKSANYYYNSVIDNGIYKIDNILNIKYSINEKFIIIELEFGNLFINRKTLEHSFNKNITARCELAKDEKFFFDLLKERNKELNNQIKKNQ